VDNSTQAHWLDEMTFLHLEFGKVFLMKVVGKCLFLPPTKFHVIWPSRTRDMGKMLSSVGWITGQILTSLLWPNFEFENGKFGSYTIHEHCRPIF